MPARALINRPMNPVSVRRSSPISRSRLAALCLAVVACAAPARAVFTWENIQFGGFASQGYIDNSGHNDYFGDSSAGTFDFREYAANASWSSGRWRIGAQVFGQKLGVYGDDQLMIDWATLDYQFTQGFGLRVGQVKMPRGLYNESLDLDSVRPFVLLPQGVYDNRLRDFNASFRGVMAYGNFTLRQAGSLDYRVYYGQIPIAGDSGALDYFHNDQPFVNVSMKIDAVIGGSFFWNPPVPGLRVGYSYSSFRHPVSTRIVLIPGIPGISVTQIGEPYDRHLFSVEYSVGDWVWAAEAGRSQAGLNYYDDATGGAFVVSFAFRSDYYYLSAARRLNRWLELGAYYSYSHDETVARRTALPATPVNPILTQGDYALSARFDVNEHVIFKLEGHYMDGSGKIFDTYTHRQPAEQRDESWTMIAAKITLSF